MSKILLITAISLEIVSAFVCKIFPYSMSEIVRLVGRMLVRHIINTPPDISNSESALESVLRYTDLRCLSYNQGNITLCEMCPNKEFFLLRIFPVISGKYGPVKTPCLDTFHTVLCFLGCKKGTSNQYTRA